MRTEAVNPFLARTDGTIDMLATSMVGNMSDTMDELVKLRVRRGYTIEDIASHLGMSPHRVESMELEPMSTTLEELLAYALVVTAHVELTVSDGEQWARDLRMRRDPTTSQATHQWLHKFDSESPSTGWDDLVSLGISHRGSASSNV